MDPYEFGLSYHEHIELLNYKKSTLLFHKDFVIDMVKQFQAEKDERKAQIWLKVLDDIESDEILSKTDVDKLCEWLHKWKSERFVEQANRREEAKDRLHASSRSRCHSNRRERSRSRSRGRERNRSKRDRRSRSRSSMHYNRSRHNRRSRSISPSRQHKKVRRRSRSTSSEHMHRDIKRRSFSISPVRPGFESQCFKGRPTHGRLPSARDKQPDERWRSSADRSRPTSRHRSRSRKSRSPARKFEERSRSKSVIFKDNCSVSIISSSSSSKSNASSSMTEEQRRANFSKALGKLHQVTGAEVSVPELGSPTERLKKMLNQPQKTENLIFKRRQSVHEQSNEAKSQKATSNVAISKPYNTPTEHSSISSSEQKQSIEPATVEISNYTDDAKISEIEKSSKQPEEVKTNSKTFIGDILNRLKKQNQQNMETSKKLDKVTEQTPQPKPKISKWDVPPKTQPNSKELNSVNESSVEHQSSTSATKANVSDQNNYPKPASDPNKNLQVEENTEQIQSDPNPSIIAEIEKERDPRIRKRRMSMFMVNIPENSHEPPQPQLTQLTNVTKESLEIRDPRIRRMSMSQETSMIAEQSQNAENFSNVGSRSQSKMPQRRSSMYVDAAELANMSTTLFKKFVAPAQSILTQNPNLSPVSSLSGSISSLVNSPNGAASGLSSISSTTSVQSKLSSISDNTICGDQIPSPLSMSSISDCDDTQQVGDRSICDDKKLKLSSQMQKKQESSSEKKSTAGTLHGSNEQNGKTSQDSDKFMNKSQNQQIRKSPVKENDLRASNKSADVKNQKATIIKPNIKSVEKQKQNDEWSLINHPKFREVTVPEIKDPTLPKNFKIPKKSDALKNKTQEEKLKTDMTESRIDHNKLTAEKTSVCKLGKNISQPDSNARNEQQETSTAKQQDKRTDQILSQAPSVVELKTKAPAVAAKRKKRSRELENLWNLNANYHDVDAIVHSAPKRQCALKKNYSTDQNFIAEYNPDDYPTRAFSIEIEKFPNLDFSNKKILKNYERHVFNKQIQESDESDESSAEKPHELILKKAPKRKSAWSRGVIQKKSKGLNDSWQDIEENDKKFDTTEIISGEIFLRMLGNPGGISMFTLKTDQYPIISESMLKLLSTIQNMSFFHCREGICFQCGVCSIKTQEDDLFTEHLKDHSETCWTGSCKVCNLNVSGAMSLAEEFDHLLTHIDKPLSCQTENVEPQVDGDSNNFEENVETSPTKQLNGSRDETEHNKETESENSIIQESTTYRSGVVSNLKEWIVKPWSDEVTSKFTNENENNLKRLASLYKCMDRFCAFYTNDSKVFLVHMACHSHGDDGNKSYMSCPYCSFSAMDKHSDLTDHIKKTHEISSFLCGYCYFRSYSDFQVFFHQKNYHSNQPFIILKSTDCPTFLPKVREIREELKKRLQPSICPAPQCTAKTFILADFQTHIEKAHKELRLSHTPLKCKFLCGSSCNIEECVEHQAKVHNIMEFNCVYCNFAGVHQQDMMKHFQLHHFDQMPLFLKREQTPVSGDKSSKTFISTDDLLIKKITFRKIDYKEEEGEKNEAEQYNVAFEMNF